MSPDFTYMCPDFIAHVPPELSPVIANWDSAACKSLTPVLSHLPIPCDYKAEPTSPLPLDLLLLSAINIPFFCSQSPMYYPSPNCSAYELGKAWTCNSVRLERVGRLSFSLWRTTSTLHPLHNFHKKDPPGSSY